MRVVNKDLLIATGDRIQMRGTRCDECGEVFFGRRSGCEHCQSIKLTEITLSERGVIYSFTILRHRPPGAYRGSPDRVPMPVGWVELPEGVRLLAPVRCPVDAVQIGMPVRFMADLLYRDGDEDVYAYAFAPDAGGQEEGTP